MAEKRDKDYSQLDTYQEDLAELYKDVEKAFEAKSDQKDNNSKFWDIYNCKLGDEQSYFGTSEVFIPIVHDAINARVLRFTNTLFPSDGRHVDCVSGTADRPYQEISLLEHYIGKAKLRELLPALLRNGDVEGQYSVYVDWNETKRFVTSRTSRYPQVNGMDDVTKDKIEDIDEEEITDAFPGISLLHADDLAVVPATVDDIDDAIAEGGFVAVVMRLSKAAIKKKIRDGDFNKEAGDKLVEAFSDAHPERKDPAKALLRGAGVKTEGGKKTATIYQVWTMMKVKKERRLYVIHFGGPGVYLGMKRCPYWCDRQPVISTPAEKVAGAFWGRSKVASVERLQYQANDAANMGLDSARYALNPIVMTDPLANPRVGSMVLAQAAIWMTSPKDTSVVQFPPLYKDALELVATCKSQIMESLSVNPSMMPQGQGGNKKVSQAESAQMAQVAVESTADPVTIIETGILSPMVNRFALYDHQFRDDELLVQMFGEQGIQAVMEEVPPIQWENRFVFKWYGQDAFKSQQQVQSMIAGLNILRGMPPQVMNGKKIDLSPIIEELVSIVYGARLAPRILIDERAQQSLDPDRENHLMLHNLPAGVHPLDNDAEHIASHMDFIKEHVEHSPQYVAQVKPLFDAHIAQHLQQISQKSQAAQPKPQGQPGVPGGAGPGVAGSPRPGAVPSVPRGGQRPPGLPGPDQTVDPSRAPRAQRPAGTA